MRTTLTLDADVFHLVEGEVHRARKPFKQVVNDAIRRGLSPHGAGEAQAVYRVTAHHAALLPGLDRTALNKYADEMEDATFLASAHRKRS
jgi:hypothetical protein